MSADHISFTQKIYIVFPVRSLARMIKRECQRENLRMPRFPKLRWATPKRT